MLEPSDNSVTSYLQQFIKENIPEHILALSRDLLKNGWMQQFDRKDTAEGFEVTATVHSDDLQTYSLRCSICGKDGRISHYCNCDDGFSGVCRHVGAALLKLEDMTKPKSRQLVSQPPGEWRQVFRSFFAVPPEPEAGRQYLIIQIHPENERFQVAFFRARQNKSGLSPVRSEITLDQIMRNTEWCDLSPHLPEVARHIGECLDYYGHKVQIPDGLLTWFIWAIRREFHIFWRDTDSYCRVDSHSPQLKIMPLLTESGLTFDVLLESGDRPPVSLKGQEVYFYGRLPMWVCWRRAMVPVQTNLNIEQVHALAAGEVFVPQDEISDFLDRVWSRMHTSDLQGQDAFLEQIQSIFVPARYSPKLFLDEEGSLLTLHIQNTYETEHGEIVMPGPNPDYQTGSYQEGDRICLVRREREKEAELINDLNNMGFQPRSNSVWFLEPEEGLDFLLDSYPAMVAKYRIFGERTLSRYKIQSARPVVNAVLEGDKDNQWFNLDLSVQYDSEKVNIKEIWEAWIQGRRYIQLKDGSYASLPEAWLKKMGHKLEALGLDPEEPPKVRYKQYEAPVLDNILEDLPEARTDEVWTKLRDKIRNFKEIAKMPQPEGLNVHMRPYQLDGLSYLNFLWEYGFGGVLADEMGLGKTIQTLALIQHLVNNRKSDGPNLIIVPTSVLPNWEREAERFAPGLRRLMFYGPKREAALEHMQDYDLVVTTYALLRLDLAELSKIKFNSVILDEAQNIKNPNTITARAVRNLQANFRLCLSGTPIENNLLELWSLFEFLMPGFLGTQHSFLRGIVKPIRDGDEEILSYLRTRAKPFILRRTKSEVAGDLPAKVESVYYCAMGDEQTELYVSLARRLREQIMRTVDEKGIANSRMSILDALLKLRQICCHPRLLKIDMPGFSAALPSGKFEAFKDMVQEIVTGDHKVLVFSQFVQMLQIIRSWLQLVEIPHAYLDGSSKDRFQEVERFNNDPALKIFLISLKAGGTGLNLTSADYVIHYDPWWNPAVENQATDRTHRIGQTKQVFSYKLICKDTVEERIIKLQDVKRDVAASVIPGQDMFKMLTPEDLEMLFNV